MNNQIVIDNLTNYKQLLIEEVTKKNEQIEYINAAIELLTENLKEKKDKVLVTTN